MIHLTGLRALGLLVGVGLFSNSMGTFLRVREQGSPLAVGDDFRELLFRLSRTARTRGALVETFENYRMRLRLPCALVETSVSFV